MDKEINLDQSAAEPIVIFDIDGVIRDVSGSYRRALADTVEHYTEGAYRPSQEEIDALKSEGIWNNDWEASQELIYRYFEGIGQPRPTSSNPHSHFPISFNYEELVAFFQSRYRGPDPTHWTGYICQEPLLVQTAYFDQLTQAGIPWGFLAVPQQAQLNMFWRSAWVCNRLYWSRWKMHLVSPIQLVYCKRQIY